MKLISSKNWEEAGVTAGPSARGTLDAIIMEMCQEQGLRGHGKGLNSLLRGRRPTEGFEQGRGSSLQKN